MTLPYLPSNAKEAAWLEVVHKLTGITLLEEGTDTGPGSPDEAIELVCKRGMPATLRLVEVNIERLRPWRDVIALFFSEPVESVSRDQFFGEADEGELITRDNVLWGFSEAGEELLRLISVKAALEHAIAISDGEWGWRLRTEVGT